MDFTLSDELLEIQRVVHEFAEQEIRPHVMEWDEKQIFPRDILNRLGYLYAGQGNESPRGNAFDGLTGAEQCPDAAGNPVKVFPITPVTPNAYSCLGPIPGKDSRPPTRKQPSN